MRMSRAAADRSTRVRRRQEKLCRRWLTDAYDRTHVSTIGKKLVKQQYLLHI